MISIVVTIIAPDRPGLVSAISARAEEHGANWADSLMANMAGQFAGILHLQVPAAKAESLMAALRALNSQNIQVLVAGGEPARLPATAGRHIKLDLVGQDRPGIIHAISAELAKHGVSIEHLQTQIVSGAMSGEQLFQMQAKLTLPAHLTDSTLRAGLESLANELMVDISFDAKNAGKT